MRCRGVPRREILGIGSAGAVGLSLDRLLAAERDPGATAPKGTLGRARARSCIVIFLSGGPPQHETFDPKPNAPIEIRGPFAPIATSVAGLHFSELLPRTAGQAHRLCVIRSMTTGIHSHSTSGAYMLTGQRPRSSAESVPPGPDDWPSIAAVVGAIRPSESSPLRSVLLPEPIFNNPAIPWPGQDGGFMGAAWHPHLLRCDPAAERLQIEGLAASEALPDRRIEERRELLARLDAPFDRRQHSPALDGHGRVLDDAFSLLRSGSTRTALQIEREPAAIRDRYGRHTFGQSVLLARRLIEAGVRLVQVNFPREPGDTSASNPLWDTHRDNAARLRDVLCPQFDGTFAALLDDLADRGLLDETLVVVMGEFGRTPKINGAGGRDHWGNVFSIALAGGPVPGGSVIGASDATGAFPAERPVQPPDLAATIFEVMGIPHGYEFRDPLARPRAVTTGGIPLREICG